MDIFWAVVIAVHLQTTVETFYYNDDRIIECEMSNTRNSAMALIRAEYIMCFRSKAWRVEINAIPFFILLQTCQGMGTEPCGLRNEGLSFSLGTPSQRFV